MEQPKRKRNFAGEMNKIVYTIIFFLSLFCNIGAQNIRDNILPVGSIGVNESPLHEVRAVWLTTIGGLDWPHSYAQSAASVEKQKQELRLILDKLHFSGINTVILQTRVRATTIYPSDMEPWDGCLSGRPGTSPGYDALAFAIDECHSRGMQLHAWVVTIPVGKWNGAGCKNLRSKVPALIKKIGDDGYMDPENAATGDYLAKICADITERYDIDGIHLDYIRYPENWGRIKDHDAGRRNITRIVQKINTAVKSRKPWVMMSCSPVGKYDDLPRQWSHGWNARQIVCQDAAGWMQSGLMDALFPMMYFKGNNFYPFALDWKERSNGRIVAPGLGIYFMSPKEKNWPLTDITRELKVLRQYGMGHCYFRSKFFTDNTKGIYEFAANELCKHPALIPPMKWYDFPAPTPPSKLSLEGNHLQWDGGKDNSDGPYLIYNIYGSDSYPVDVKQPENILAVGVRRLSCSVAGRKFYAVTCVDRYNNESVPCQLNVPGYAGFEENDKKTAKPSEICPLITCSNVLKKSDISKTFNLNASTSVVAIESLQGNIVKTSLLTNDIDLSDLPPGMYVVRSIHKKKVAHRLGFVKKCAER